MSGYEHDHCYSKDDVDKLTAERDALRREVGACLLRNTELHVERDALKAEHNDLLAASDALQSQFTQACRDNERLRAEVAELQEIAVRVKLGQLEVWPDASKTQIGEAWLEVNRDLTELREAVATLSAEWRRKAEQLRLYDVGMHEVVNCADELDAALAKPTP